MYFWRYLLQASIHISDFRLLFGFVLNLMILVVVTNFTLNSDKLFSIVVVTELVGSIMFTFIKIIYTFYKLDELFF